MRVIVSVVTVLLLSVAVLLNARSNETGDAKQADSSPDTVHWVKLTMGLDDKADPWDGGVAVNNGRILQSAPWSFEPRDRFDPLAHKWFCTTVVLKGRSASSFAEPQRGVLLKIERAGDTQLAVETQQGNFTVDVAKLKAGATQTYLDGRASAELLGRAEKLPDKAIDSVAITEDDFPTIAVDKNGHRRLAWIAYEDDAKRDHLRVLDLDDPKAKVVEIPTAREQTDPRLVIDETGSPVLFWSAPQDGNWDLWMSRSTEHGWSNAERITTAEGTDFHLATARGPEGEIWITWQAFREGNSDIYARRLSNGKWSKDIRLTDDVTNEWEPSISVDGNGTAWIGYDSYRNGNYDVFLTSLSFDNKITQGKTFEIAVTEDFEAHASVEATGDGAVWVAYDAAGPNWGKDYTRDTTEFKGQYGETLHASRRLGLRAVVEGRVLEPEMPIPQKLTKLHPEKILHSDYDEMKRFYELPQLVRDGAGRLWVFFRMNRQGYAGHPKQGAHWEIWATTFLDGNWLDPMLLPLSIGRQNQKVTAAVGKNGRLQLAWSSGDHLVDLAHHVRVGQLPPVNGAAPHPKLVPVKQKKAEPAVEPTIRSWEMHHNGVTYQVYFGDLHRHTDISLCFPTADGCLVDAYRYALDAVKYDFLAVTDHTRDTDPYPWWRIQKANDLFYVKGTFAPIYGYERSNGVAGGGHRNVFFLERDWPVLRGDAHYSWAKEQRPENNYPDVALYPHLRGKKAITAAHTPGYSRQAKRGTWTYHDPQVEPIAEIIQTFRRDYERPGAPQWPDARTRGNIAEEASLWYALARGHKLGFIASSDHHATHTSYACVWAKGPKREEIFEGLSHRRTYAATDKILLEVRMGEAVMGEEIAAPDEPELTIRAQGTDDVVEVQIVRNRTVLATFSPGSKEFRTTFRDREYPGGAAYYYVRLRQRDNNMAWGSPIWVK